MTNKCKYYNANAALKKECAAGVNVRKLVGGENFGWLLRTPCIKGNKTEVTCDKRQEMTAEDVAEKEKEIERLSKTVDAHLMAMLMVDCPHCGKRFDLFDDDSDSVFLIPIFNNKWGDLEGQDVECPRCEEEFLIRKVEW